MTNDRIRDLTTGPVLRTLEGCRQRLDHISLGEWAMLCQHFSLEIDRGNPRPLIRALYTSKRRTRRLRRCIVIDRAILTAYPCIEDWSILLAYRGSIAHGMFVPSDDPNSIDDKDVVGICIPPMDHYYGLKQFGSRGTKEIMQGVWDIVLFELTKAVRMLAQGNPNVLGILWLAQEDYIKVTGAGRLLIENRDLFVGKHAYHSFVGYAKGQMSRITRGAYLGYMGQKRKALVDKFGFDPKCAAHTIRLLRMGIEFLATGAMQVKRPDAQELLAIKRGEWSLEQVHAEADRLFAKAEDALIHSSLPDGPDRERINNLCVQVAKTWLESGGSR